MGVSIILRGWRLTAAMAIFLYKIENKGNKKYEEMWLGKGNG